MNVAGVVCPQLSLPGGGGFIVAVPSCLKGMWAYQSSESSKQMRALSALISDEKTKEKGWTVTDKNEHYPSSYHVFLFIVLYYYFWFNCVLVLALLLFFIWFEDDWFLWFYRWSPLITNVVSFYSSVRTLLSKSINDQLATHSQQSIFVTVWAVVFWP